ncbi:MAG: hypothetical protein AAFW60_13320, partial [Pseudomonadota bacterium]
MRRTGFLSILAFFVCCPGVPEALAPMESERATGSVLWPGLNSRGHDHVNQRLDEIEALPRLDGGVLFVGDSITEGAPLYTMF